MNRIGFIKFFIYLTDVDSETGPHCVVRNPHRRKPRALLGDRRFSDEEVLKHYPAEDLVELTGEAGTIIAVDTRALHKAKVLERSDRLMFQFEFANSMFGAPYDKLDLPKTLAPELENALRRAPWAYPPKRYRN